MGVTVEAVDPAHVSQADLRAYYDITVARYADDRPRWSHPSYEETVASLRKPGAATHYLVRRDDGLVGHAMRRPTALEIVVHPRARRQGVGTAVLRELLAGLPGDSQVEGRELTRNGDGARWAAGIGLRATDSGILQRLVVPEVDPVLWDVPVPAGYRLVQWANRAPEDLIESYAAVRNAVYDMPGEVVRPAPWTPERVRAEETRRRAERRVVVAVHGDEVVAVTELQLYPDRPHQGRQADTAVLQAHRGHGLGRCVKAHMLRWLRVDRPLVEDINTVTSDDNVHMIRVNHSLGYITAGEMIAVNAPIAELKL